MDTSTGTTVGVCQGCRKEKVVLHLFATDKWLCWACCVVESWRKDKHGGIGHWR